MKLKLEFGSGRIDRFIEKKLGVSKQRRQIVKQHIKAARQEIKAVGKELNELETRSDNMDGNVVDTGSPIPMAGLPILSTEFGNQP